MKQRLQIRGVTYTVDVIGAGEPLLLLHGFTGSGAVFQPLLAAWQNQFRCIMPDLLGHGETDAPVLPARYSMAETVADLCALLDAFDAPVTNVLGYSMGGRIALGFALAHRERVHRLVLEGASPGLRTQTERQQRQLADGELATAIERNGVAAFVDKWEEIPLFASQKRLPAAVFARQREIRLAQRGEGLANSLRGIGTGQQPDYWPRLRLLDLPTLLVTGELDEKFTALNRAMASVMPQARHVVIADAGHTPHLEQPSAFCNVVSTFLSC